MVVVPDGGGEGQDSLQDADPDPGRRVSAVLFEVELAFEGVEDGFDPLADAAEVPEAGFLIFVGAFE